MASKDEIKLLEKAICGYLPYKVKAVKNNVIHTITAVNTRYNFCELDEEINEQMEDIKLFLRPMESMNEEEKKEYQEVIESLLWTNEFDFYNKHHFDYRGLIEKGLALEAPDRMYNF